MNHEQLLRALLAKAYKKQDTEIDAILSATDETEAETQLLEVHNATVSQLSKPKPGSTFQDGYAKGKKEVLTEVEGKLKSAFELEEAEAALQGDDLISAIVEKKAKEVSTTDLTKLTAEDIKKLPAYQPVQREFNKQLQQVKTEAENKIKEIETGYAKKQVLAQVSKVGLKALEESGAVLPKNVTAAERQKSSFLKEFEALNWIEDGNDFIAVNEDGTTKVDEQGNAIRASEFGKAKVTEWFDIAANNGGSNSGNSGTEAGTNRNAATGSGKVQYPTGYSRPKDQTEFAAIMNDRSKPIEERKAYATAYETELAEGSK
ncbi:MAG TPA: hypothetical protein VD794_16035 [Flavisolibacter sp.]|nr:hypothetical protein [Flavisolibacter sp.]